MPSETDAVLDESTQQFALLIASVVRNAMEDFHCAHLNDSQMRQLNPLVRNAVATALHAFSHYERSGPARRFVDFHLRCIPKYWEPPQLLEDYLAMRKRGNES